jgi:hypothetical protein
MNRVFLSTVNEIKTKQKKLRSSQICYIQDSQGTRKAFLAETEELAYDGRAKDQKRWHSDGERVKEAIILFLLFIWDMVRLVLTIKKCQRYRNEVKRTCFFLKFEQSKWSERRLLQNFKRSKQNN